MIARQVTVDGHHVDVSSYPRARREASFGSRTVPTSGMRGVRVASCVSRQSANRTTSDVEIHHLETPHPLKFSNLRVAENGPLRASIDADASYGDSKIQVTVRRCHLHDVSQADPFLRSPSMLFPVGLGNYRSFQC